MLGLERQRRSAERLGDGRDEEEATLTSLIPFSRQEKVAAGASSRVRTVAIWQTGHEERWAESG